MNYVVRCTAPGCANPAGFKIAARWSDGVTHELKTYSLCCERCLNAELGAAEVKQQACRLALGESLEPPAVFARTAGGLVAVGIDSRT